MRRSTTLSRVVTYAGIDYHKKFSVVTLGDQKGKAISTQRLPNDRHAIENTLQIFLLSNVQWKAVVDMNGSWIF